MKRVLNSILIILWPLISIYGLAYARCKAEIRRSITYEPYTLLPVITIGYLIFGAILAYIMLICARKYRFAYLGGIFASLFIVIDFFLPFIWNWYYIPTPKNYASGISEAMTLCGVYIAMFIYSHLKGRKNYS